MNWRLGALVGGGVLLLTLAIVAAGASPIATLQTLLHGSLGTKENISGTLREMTPLLLAGIAVFVALRAGLFNIGVEGQLLVGAMVTAVIGVKFPGPVGIVLGVLAGMVTGALWALPAALIKAYRNGHEVITTIMLNNIAIYLTTAMVAGPIKDPQSNNTSTAAITDSTRIPNLIWSQPQVNFSLVIALLMAIGLGAWLKRTVLGYELQATGANETAAKFAGVATKRISLLAMTASGAIGGLAGAFQVLASEGRFYADFSHGYGYDSLGVALLAGSNALALVPSSLLFAILSRGGTAVQIDGVPKGITTVILGILILIAAAIRYRKVKSIA